MPAGTARSDTTELLASARMESFVNEAARRFPRQIVLVDQQAHQFRHGERRMGVVELDRHFVRQHVEGSGGGPVDLLEVVADPGGANPITLLPNALSGYPYTVIIEKIYALA